MTDDASVTAGPSGGSGILQVHPTRRCNLRCLHCYSSSGPDVREALPIQLLEAAVIDAAELGYEVLSVSGGEPLLYRDLDRLLDAAHAARMTTTVTTNGMMLTSSQIQSLAGRADLIAVSVDGPRDDHNAMRGSPRAFDAMARGLDRLGAGGIPFGVIFTLTQFNVHQIEEVARFAVDAGARLLQIHPLEAEGAALEQLSDAIPDARELAFAMLECARLGDDLPIVLQVDVLRQRDLLERPDQFLALTEPPDAPLGRWLTPLVVETGGRVVPLTYGVDDELALGSLHTSGLRDMALEWQRSGSRALLDRCREAREMLIQPDGPEFVNWYEAVAHAPQSVAVSLGARQE